LFNEFQKEKIKQLEKTDSWMREEDNYNYLVEMVYEELNKL